MRKSVDKAAWQIALHTLNNAQKQELETFFDNYAIGMDISMPCHALNAHTKKSPKLDLQSKCKIVQTMLKWHKKGCLMDPYTVSHPIAEKCRMNLVFCVPKPDGSLRPVLNYSYLINGNSLNEPFVPKSCTVEYVRFNNLGSEP